MIDIAQPCLDELIEPGRTITYGVVKPGNEDENGVRFVRGGDIQNGKVDVNNLRTITEDISKSYSRTLLRGGELLISLVGNPGNVAIAPDSLIGANIARQVGLIPLRNGINAKYVMYYLMSPNGKAQLFMRTQGAVQQVINLADVKKIPIKLPNPETQRTIADILSAYDDLIENNKRRIELLEDSARQLYKEWFVRFRFPGHEHIKIIDSVPEGWRKGCVADLGEVITGKTPPTNIKENFGGDIPFIKTPDMHASSIIFDPEEYLSERGANTQPNKFLPRYSVLVACIGARLGVVSLNAQRCQTNQQINAVIPKDEIYIFYAYLTLKGFREKLLAIGGGATMPNVNKSKFSSMEIFLPPKSLLETFQDVVSQSFFQIEKLIETNVKLAQARNILLPKLMSGEIVV